MRMTPRRPPEDAKLLQAWWLLWRPPWRGCEGFLAPLEFSAVCSSPEELGQVPAKWDGLRRSWLDKSQSQVGLANRRVLCG